VSFPYNLGVTILALSGLEQPVPPSLGEGFVAMAANQSVLLLLLRTPVVSVEDGAEKQNSQHRNVKYAKACGSRFHVKSPSAPEEGNCIEDEVQPHENSKTPAICLIALQATQQLLARELHIL
jgi:hypothetical protein